MRTREKSWLPVAAILAAATTAFGQDRFETLPGHERYQLVSEKVRELRGTGRVSSIHWTADAVRFTRDGERYRLDLDTYEITEEAEDGDDGARSSAQPAGRPRRPRVPRGRQAAEATSPDGAWTAKCVDYNVVLEPVGASGSLDVTTEGDRKLRYGMASWVYGEELGQSTAMWWSPDSRRLAFYELDERHVADYYLTTGNTEWRTDLAIEGYPKAGEPNPVARLHVYDLKTRRTTAIDVGDEREQYVFLVRWSPDGELLLFNRTNRMQNVLELVAADPKTGRSRVVVTETQRTWQRNRPMCRFLADGRRFLWETEKSGYAQYELRDLDGSLITTLSRGSHPVRGLVKLVEPTDDDPGAIFYMAAGGDTPLDEHLYMASLDGGEPRRLTQEPAAHRVWLSPDGRWFVTTYETVESPPVTALYAVAEGRVATLAEPDTSSFDELGLERPELFSFTTDDGVTTIYGKLFKPSGFDPQASYPLVIDVYGGPMSRRVRNRWEAANALCELGFLIAVVDNRGTSGRGKAFAEAVYLQCGTIDLADQAAGVRHLAQRPYVDGDRVGIFGHSYGGYMSALAILKHPDVFHVSVSSSPVTDWRNYDTIYTERYMRTPQENPRGYDEGSCLTYAEQLEGELMLLHGMVDDNVHPANTWQLVDALQRAGKRHTMHLFPNSAHGLPRRTLHALRWEFLHEHLIRGD